MGNTKKVGTTGRFGVRYGRSIRKRVLAVETKQKSLQTAPKSGFNKIKRLAPGIFKDIKTGEIFAGGAYTATTMTGRIVNKMVKQREFLPHVGELIESKEKTEKSPEQKPEPETKPVKKEKQTKKTVAKKPKKETKVKAKTTTKPKKEKKKTVKTKKEEEKK